MAAPSEFNVQSGKAPRVLVGNWQEERLLLEKTGTSRTATNPVKQDTTARVFGKNETASGEAMQTEIRGSFKAHPAVPTPSSFEAKLRGMPPRMQAEMRAAMAATEKSIADETKEQEEHKRNNDDRFAHVDPNRCTLAAQGTTRTNIVLDREKAFAVSDEPINMYTYDDTFHHGSTHKNTSFSRPLEESQENGVFHKE